MSKSQTEKAECPFFAMHFVDTDEDTGGGDDGPSPIGGSMVVGALRGHTHPGGMVGRSRGVAGDAAWRRVGSAEDLSGTSDYSRSYTASSTS
jgi:hypothetical protein